MIEFKLYRDSGFDRNFFTPFEFRLFSCRLIGKGWDLKIQQFNTQALGGF
jgi:hypothetical protein